MSGSPVYVDGKLLGALSYRIGEFSKEPIAGITPIEQMLEVRDASDPAQQTASTTVSASQGFVPIETPLVLSGFMPEAVKIWQDQLRRNRPDVACRSGRRRLQPTPA